MIRRVLFTAAVVAALAGGGALALAQTPQAAPGPRGGPGPRAHFGGPIGDLGLRGIALADAQREQVRAIMESHKGEFDQVGSALREAHRAFAQAVNAEPIDEATVRARSTAVAAAMAEEALLRARVRTEVHAILTAEQLEQLKQRRAEREKRLQDGPPGPRRRGRR